jgi:hypothetical protein
MTFENDVQSLKKVLTDSLRPYRRFHWYLARLCQTRGDNNTNKASSVHVHEPSGAEIVRTGSANVLRPPLLSAW